MALKLNAQMALGSIAFRTVLANPSGAAIARILSAGCNNPAAVLRDGGNADEQDKAGARRRMGHGIEPAKELSRLALRGRIGRLCGKIQKSQVVLRLEKSHSGAC
jgi:hypothetical protein